MQTAFAPAVREAVTACRDHFGGELSAFYLAGSVAFGEAWPGVSDVDSFAFLQREPSDEDLEWARHLSQELADRHKPVDHYALTVCSVDRLRREHIWRFILRDNSERLSGHDLIGALAVEGVSTALPDRSLAESRLPWLRKLVEATAVGRFSEVVFKLPEDPALASRKLARWLILVEGAHLLMADGGFVSFRQNDILRQLQEHYPDWSPMFETTTAILKDPYAAAVPPDAFARQATDFLKCGIERITAGMSSERSS